jgi:hypothetical protein
MNPDKNPKHELNQQPPEVIGDLIALAGIVPTHAFQQIHNPSIERSDISTQTDQILETKNQPNHDEFHAMAYTLIEDILADPNNTLEHSMAELGFDMDNPVGFTPSGERPAIALQYLIKQVEMTDYESPSGMRRKIVIDLSKILGLDNIDSIAFITAKDAILNLDLMKHKLSPQYFKDSFMALLQKDRISNFFETPSLTGDDIYSAFYRNCFGKLKCLEPLKQAWTRENPAIELEWVRKYAKNPELHYNQLQEFYTNELIRLVTEHSQTLEGLKELSGFFNPESGYLRIQNSRDANFLFDLQRVIMGVNKTPLYSAFDNEHIRVTGLSMEQYAKGIKVMTDSFLEEYLSTIPQEFIQTGPKTITIDYDPAKYTQGSVLENHLDIRRSIIATVGVRMPWDLVSSDLNNEKTKQLRAQLEVFIGPLKEEYLSLIAELNQLNNATPISQSDTNTKEKQIETLKKRIIDIVTQSPAKEIREQMRYYGYGYSDVNQSRNKKTDLES